MVKKHKVGRSIARVHHYGRAFSMSVNGRSLLVQVRYITLPRWSRLAARITILATCAVLLFTIIIPAIGNRLAEKNYNLTSTETSLLPSNDSVLQKDISYDDSKASYEFASSAKDPSQAAGASTSVTSDSTMIRATIPSNASTGVNVTDPINDINLSITPEMNLVSAVQDGSHIYYPLADGSGQLVYSPQATNILEDLLLRSVDGNSMHFDYKLGLNGSMQARLQHDGSVNIYGSELASLGTINYDNAKDGARVQKAEENATKDKLLFTIPAPTVRETDRGKSIVRASYSLLDNGATLRITATNLSKASFPIDIDPTVSVSSVTQLYRDTNGESNVDFNTTNGTITRGAVTGGVFSSWNTNANSLNTSRYLGSAVVSNGYIYEGGGANSSTNTNLKSMEYAQISSVDNTIGAWSTTSAMPDYLSQYRLLSYNGYLYILGGSSGSVGTSGGCASPTTSVYYNPTQPNGALASTWTATTAMPTALCSFGAAIYNNTIYIVGGQTAGGASSGTAAVSYASILPNGAIGSWTTTSFTSLPALFDNDVQVYNGYLYVIGGNSSTATVSTIYRAVLNSDGSIYGSSSTAWTSLPNTFAIADGSTGLSNAGGGSFTAVNDGYMYASGGCAVVTASSQDCSAVSGSTYVAQINADGTLGPWSAISSSNTDTEVGGSVISFGGYIYNIGGCTAMSTSATFGCQSGDTLATQLFTQIQSSGQIGPVATQTNNIPPTDGLYQEGAVVANGYLYLIGGCLTASCSTGNTDTSSAIYYAQINANGSIGAFATSAYTINGVTKGGLGAIDNSVVVYDNYIYVIGGYNYAGSTNNTTAFNGSSSAADVVWYAKLSTTSADLNSSFTAYTTTLLSQGSYGMAAVADRGYIYAMGGCSAGHNAAGCSTYYTTSYRITVGTAGISAINTTSVAAIPSGTEVSACTAIGTGAGKLETLTDCFPGIAAMGIALYNGYIYIMGGADGSGTTGNGESVIIEYGKISATNTITSWSTASSFLPYSSAIGYRSALRRTAAFAYNDNLYVVGGHDGDTGVVLTSPNIDIGQINLATGDITSETTSSQTLPDKEWDGAVAFNDGTVYVAGGCYNGSPPTSCSFSGGTGIYNNKVQSFQIYNADNTGTAAWSYATNTYAANSVGSSAVAYNGYIYDAGGCTTFTLSSQTCTAATANYSYAALNPDGSVAAWTSGTLPGGTAFGCLTQDNGYLYYIGGENTAQTSQSNVYYSLIGASGVPGAWTATTSLATLLPNGLQRMGCDSFDGVIYLTGGLSNTTYENNVYYAVPSASNGTIPTGTGTWTTFGTNTFTNARAGLSTIAAGGYLYILGGYNGTTYYNDVQSISINPSTGAPIASSWTATRSFAYPAAFMGATVANGYMFLFGGNNATSGTADCSNNAMMAPILNTGSTGDWTQGVAEYASNGNANDGRIGAPATFYNGYYYILGGYDCTGSAIVSSSTIAYSGEQSQAMTAFFTRYADLGGDASPELFLPFVTNAQINSTDIEDWKMTYITCTQESNVWGISTTISPLKSGNVSTVYAYNSTGTQVYLNRYVQLAFSISMVKSFTFPDTTQPSVNSYYMYYSPAANNRLRNGKVFQDEQQQGLDLNY